MKKITLLSFLLIASMGFSQVNPVNFEPGGNGADWTFVVFVNGDDPPVEIVPNPSVSGANTSATVAMFTVRAAGADFAGAFSDDIGTFTLNATNSTVRLKVYKSKISDVGIKFENGSGAIGEIKVANTLINQWEELTFNFASFIGTPGSIGINRFVIFPDFEPRSADTVVYFDDLTFSAILGVDEFQTSNFKVYPNPTIDSWTIKSETAIITSLQVFDIQGKQIMFLQPNSLEASINPLNFAQGVYVARISSDKGTETVKLVKQ